MIEVSNTDNKKYSHDVGTYKAQPKKYNHDYYVSDQGRVLYYYRKDQSADGSWRTGGYLNAANPEHAYYGSGS